MGGEKEWTVHYHRQTEGSPPRGRGKGIKRSSHAHQTGITPAWAGKSRSFISFHFFGEDHPRVGGEKLPVFSICAGVSGSPPRGRGKVTRLYALADLEGITPAWAGKSCGRAAPRAQKRDHPRVGGEKALMPTNALVVKGSPPRGRGKARRGSRAAVATRITPAWAGKRTVQYSWYLHPQDHPRVGGEKTKKIP